MMSSFGIAAESCISIQNRQVTYRRNRCQIYGQSLGVWQSPNDRKRLQLFQVRGLIPNRLDDALNRISHFRTNVKEIFRTQRTMIDGIYKVRRARFMNGPEASFSFAGSPVPEDGGFSFSNRGPSFAFRSIAVVVDSNTVLSTNIVGSSSRGSSN